MAPVKADRKLVLVVGSGSKNRTEVARRLISDDHAVVLCPGPPGCPLLRDELCVLTDSADLTVIMPGTSHSPEVVAGLRMCAQASDHVVRPAAFDHPSKVDPDAVADAVRRCFERDGE